MYKALQQYAQFLKKYSSRVEVGLDDTVVYMVCTVRQSSSDSPYVAMESNMRYWFQQHGVILDNINRRNGISLKELSFYYQIWMYPLKDVTND